MVQYPVLLFDGDCSFCTTSINLIKKYAKNSVHIIPYQKVNLKEYGLDENYCERYIHFICQNKNKYTGAKAFSEFFRYCGFRGRVLGSVIRFFEIFKLSTLIYSIISKFRHKLPGGTPECKL